MVIPRFLSVRLLKLMQFAGCVSFAVVFNEFTVIFISSRVTKALYQLTSANGMFSFKGLV